MESVKSMGSKKAQSVKNMNKDLEGLSPAKQVSAAKKMEVGSPDHGSVDYVAATLNAWNQCPTIVKKQLDEQYQEIKKLKEDYKTVTLRLN